MQPTAAEATSRCKSIWRLATARSRIICDGDDTGQVEIDPELLELLIRVGVTGVPTATLTRIAYGGTGGPIPSGVYFVAQQSVARAFDIPGVTCTNDGDCPPAKYCQSNMLCQ
jgi:hypothetical protein